MGRDSSIRLTRRIKKHQWIRAGRSLLPFSRFREKGSFRTRKHASPDKPPARRARSVDLAFFLEDLLPVLDEKIESLLRRPLVGDDIVMHALLHVEEQLGVGG